MESLQPETDWRSYRFSVPRERPPPIEVSEALLQRVANLVSALRKVVLVALAVEQHDVGNLFSDDASRLEIGADVASPHHDALLRPSPLSFFSAQLPPQILSSYTMPPEERASRAAAYGALLAQLRAALSEQHTALLTVTLHLAALAFFSGGDPTPFRTDALALLEPYMAALRRRHYRDVDQVKLQSDRLAEVNFCKLFLDALPDLLGLVQFYADHGEPAKATSANVFKLWCAHSGPEGVVALLRAVLDKYATPKHAAALRALCPGAPRGMKIVCRDCVKSFYHSEQDQRSFADKGWKPPQRCKPCRQG